MSIVCCNCGSVAEGVLAVQYDIEFIENYLEDYFNRGIKDLTRNNVRDKTFTKFRAICFNILCEFTSLKPYRMARRYSVSDSLVSRAMDDVISSDHDYVFIKKDLAGRLPICK